jgi:hypothetical protein
LEGTTLTPAKYEDEANRIRDRMGATLSQLRTNLRPSNLLDEAARGIGLRDATPASVFGFGVKRHPVPTVLIGLGVGLLAFAVVRNNSSAGAAKGFVGENAASLARSATNVFRERAETRRRDLMSAADAHIKAGASQLTDMIEKGVDDFLGRLPVATAARPVMESAIQMALLAAVESLLPKLLGPRSSRSGQRGARKT